jgi:transposase
MSHEDMLHLFEFERFPVDHVIPRDREALQGHDVRLMSPEYVRPYVKAQKNDDRDAEGIAEAATRPTMRFGELKAQVELKAQEQLDMQTLHRSRDRLVGERTALINQLRAILVERGIVIAQGKRNLERTLDALLDGQDAQGLGPRMRLERVLIDQMIPFDRDAL